MLAEVRILDLYPPGPTVACPSCKREIPPDALLVIEGRNAMSGSTTYPSEAWYRRELDRTMQLAERAIEQARVALDQRDAAIREARAKALEEAAEALTSHDITSDIGEQLADADEARAWLRDRAARERGTK